MILESQVKLALLEEYKKAVRYQNFYYESCEALGSLIQRAVEYYQAQGLEIPDRADLYKLIEGLHSVVGKHSDFKESVLSPVAQRQSKSPDDATEPHLTITSASLK